MWMRCHSITYTYLKPTICLDTWDENVEHFYFKLMLTYFFFFFAALFHITSFMEYALHLFKHTTETAIHTHIPSELKFNDFILFYTLMVIGWRHTWNLFLWPTLKSGEMTGLYYFVPFCIQMPSRFCMTVIFFFVFWLKSFF